MSESETTASESVWHVTSRGDGQHTLFVEENVLRACVRALTRASSGRSLLFNLVDNHVHQALVGDRRRIEYIGRATTRMVGRLVPTPLEPARPRPVTSRSHLQSLVGYILRQPTHHDLPVHPALWSGSCFLDLVGARHIPGLRLRVFDWLPRLRLRELFPHVGLRPQTLRPLECSQVRRLGAYRVVAAAAAARCVAAGLCGNEQSTVQARAGAVQLARSAGIPAGEMLNALRVTRRTFDRLTHADVGPRTIEAIGLRLALEEAVAAASGK